MKSTWIRWAALITGTAFATAATGCDVQSVLNQILGTVGLA
jgi:hypothetical protein